MTNRIQATDEPLPGTRNANDERLFSVFVGNGAFSLFSGSTFLLARPWLENLFPQAPTFLFPILGVGLILFSIDLFRHAIRKEISYFKGWYFTLSDFSWVAGSIAILLLAETMLPLGRILVWSTAAIVFIFAILQGWHLLSKPNPLSSAR